MFESSDYSFGIHDIASYMHTKQHSTETFKQELRLKSKWEKYKDSLNASAFRTNSLIADWQLERLSLLIDFAFSNHPFYNKLYKSVGYNKGDILTWEDYNSLPAISKDDIIENYELFLHANLSPHIEECNILRTSGSSGKVLNIIRDTKMTEQMMLFQYRFYEQMLGRPRNDSEWLYELYIASPDITSMNGKFPTFTISNDCPVESILDHIMLLKPTLLTGLSSAIGRLGAIIADHKDLGIKAVGTNSESSTEGERELISQQFGVPVFDEYSSVELSLIATQCNQKKYHLIEDNVRVDTLKDDTNGFGEIVATNLHNTFMPFIRYKQGDIIKINNENTSCICGNRFRYLDSFMGRTDQFLYSKKIGKIAPDLIMSLYDRTLILADANIEEFQIVQKNLDQINLIIVPFNKSKDINQELILLFSDGLKNIFKDYSISIIVDKYKIMPPEKSHKRRLIKCEIDPKLIALIK